MLRGSLIYWLKEKGLINPEIERAIGISRDIVKKMLTIRSVLAGILKTVLLRKLEAEKITLIATLQYGGLKRFELPAEVISEIRYIANCNMKEQLEIAKQEKKERLEYHPEK